MDLHKRIAALERTTGPESPQEIAGEVLFPPAIEGNPVLELAA